MNTSLNLIVTKNYSWNVVLCVELYQDIEYRPEMAKILYVDLMKYGASEMVGTRLSAMPKGQVICKLINEGEKDQKVLVYVPMEFSTKEDANLFISCKDEMISRLLKYRRDTLDITTAVLYVENTISVITEIKEAYDLEVGKIVKRLNDDLDSNVQLCIRNNFDFDSVPDTREELFAFIEKQLSNYQQVKLREYMKTLSPMPPSELAENEMLDTFCMYPLDIIKCD